MNSLMCALCFVNGKYRVKWRIVTPKSACSGLGSTEMVRVEVTWKIFGLYWVGNPWGKLGRRSQCFCSESCGHVIYSQKGHVACFVGEILLWGMTACETIALDQLL